MRRTWGGRAEDEDVDVGKRSRERARRRREKEELDAIQKNKNPTQYIHIEDVGNKLNLPLRNSSQNNLPKQVNG